MQKDGNGGDRGSQGEAEVEHGMFRSSLGQMVAMLQSEHRVAVDGASLNTICTNLRSVVSHRRSLLGTWNSLPSISEKTPRVDVSFEENSCCFHARI